MTLDGQKGRAMQGDFDGDSQVEIVSGKRWHRPASFQRGDIPGGLSLECVGTTAGDMDGDGLPEIIGGALLVTCDINRQLFGREN